MAIIIVKRSLNARQLPQSMTYLRTTPLSQAVNSVLPLEVYLKIQTLHVNNTIFKLGLINQMT